MKSPSSNNIPASDVDDCNVFVKFLPCEFTEKDLFNLFQPYGDIVNTKVMINTKTGTSLGYGFVRFSDPSEAREAISKMNRVQIGYKVLLCKLSKPIQAPTINPFSLLDDSELRDPSPTIYVRILSPTITDAMLRAAFAPFGDVLECQVHICSVSGKSKRSGYIKYSTVEEATAAIHSMRGSLLLGETPLIVKYANGRLSNKPERPNSCSTSPVTSTMTSPSLISQPTPTQPINILLNNNQNNHNLISSVSYYHHSPENMNIQVPQPPPQQIPAQFFVYAPPHHQDIYVYHPGHSHFYSPDYDYPISPSSTPSPPSSPTHHFSTPSTTANPHHPYFIYAPAPAPSFHGYHQPQPMEFMTIDDNNPNSTTLICTYSEDIDFSELYDTFSNYGSLQSLKINKSTDGKFQSIITFTNIDHAVNAKHCLDRSKIGSQRIRIDYDEVFCL